MKLLLLEETEFRGKVIKVSRKADIPDGVAFKLIANGKAKKISDEEFNAFDIDKILELEDLNVLKVDELKEVCKHLGLPTSGKKDELIALIQETIGEKAIDLDGMDEAALIALAEKESITFREDEDAEGMRTILSAALGIERVGE